MTLRAALGMFAITIFGTAAAVGSEGVATVNPMMESGGNAAKFSNFRFNPNTKPTLLAQVEAPNRPQLSITDKANALFTKNDGALTLLLLDRGKILYEGYKSPATASTAQHSMSMSKSLTAYIIGPLLCDGQIASLDDRADLYAPQLKGTVYGESSIRHLLTMSSGAYPATSSGNSYDGQFDEIRAGKVSSLDAILRFGARDLPSGKEFRYLANDTQALGLIIESLGGFAKNFEQQIWSQIGAEAAGFWLLDKENIAIANAGASMIARDWGRLAEWTIKKIKSSNTCMGEFMRVATSAQIPNSSKRVGASFPSYGYQTWIRKRGYWWVGFGGQRVGIDPKSERILVLTSWREDYMDQVYRLFDDWITAY